MNAERRNGPTPVSRRRFLGGGAVALGGLYLAGLTGCGESASEGKAQGIKIPNTGADLPQGDVTFRWIDSGDAKAAFWEKYFPAYENKHPNIKIEYDGLPWDEIAEVVPLGIRNGTAHDVLALPPGITGAQAVHEGWVQPVDDFIPDFENWKSAFPPNTFFEGVHVFDGKTYTFPVSSNKRCIRMLLYNKELMDRAGYDPSSDTLTWDEFREAARKITKQGNGRAYGAIVEGGDPPYLEQFVGFFGHIGGAPTLGPLHYWIDPRNGEHAFTADEFLEAIDLLIGLKRDGSIFPGAASMNEPEARARVPTGVIGMMVQGPWNIAEWEETSPDFAFDVANHPVPDTGRPIPFNYSQANLANSSWLYSKSKLGPVAGDIFGFVGSLDGQKVWSSLTNPAVVPPVFPEVAASSDVSPQGQKALQLNEKMILAPDPVIRNPEIWRAYAEIKPLSPDFGETIQALFVGDMDDPKKAMKTLKDRFESELDRAVKAARDKGANVSREDWVFSNWDPFKDYTEEDYKEL